VIEVPQSSGLMDASLLLPSHFKKATDSCIRSTVGVERRRSERFLPSQFLSPGQVRYRARRRFRLERRDKQI
jgi:hypothetical protein